MIETTYIRLAQAAEVLGTDQGTLLIAGAEARIELHGLFNQIVRAVKKEHVATDAPWEVDTVIVDQARMRISFVPLQPHSCAELIRKGDTGEIQYLTDIGGDGIAWEVDEDIDVGYIPLDLIFVKRGDIEAIKSEHATPAPGTIKDVPPAQTDRSHVSDELVLLNQAARRWWANADRHDPATHPGNAAVAAWLIEKGMTKSLAERAASIIRPEWAHTGRKPDA